MPGTVTKYFGGFCNYVLTGFKETYLYLKNFKTIYTGTPLRDSFYFDHQSPSWVPKGDGPLIVVMGGSQGAKGVNEIFYHSLDLLLDNSVRIVHIIGNSLKIKICHL